MTQMEVYNVIYKENMKTFMDEGKTADKASRLANVIAVKSAWIEYNKNKKG